MKTRYQIMLIPSLAGKIKQYKITSFHLTLIQILIILNLSVLGGFGLIIYRYLKLEGERNTLKSQNLVLKDFVSGVEEKMLNLENEQQNIVLLSHKMKAATGISDPGTNVSIGPLSATDYELLFSVKNNIQSEKIKRNLNLDLDQIKLRLQKNSEKSKLIETELSSFFEKFKDKTSILYSTPTIMPAHGMMTSTFGWRISPFSGTEQFHEGIDISSDEGSPIYATANGLVTFVGEYGSYGFTVMINHGYGKTTLYGHLQPKQLVKIGQEVKRNEKIALMGNTGRSTGPHLHYEVRNNNVPVNPMKYVISTTSFRNLD